MERPWLSRLIGRLIWGGDTRRYYESMRAVEEMPSGGTIVDCPCGAGPAFRAVEPGRHGRYLAVDLSPSMLRRARQRATERGIADIEFAKADARAIPIPDGDADLFLSFWGLHCYEDPAAALREAGRVVKQGGRLVGACFVSGRAARQRLMLREGRGDFGRIGSEADVRDWLHAAGFEIAGTDRSGLYFFFSARRRAPGR
jgi:SAM-dependent methyltransferase